MLRFITIMLLYLFLSPYSQGQVFISKIKDEVTLFGPENISNNPLDVADQFIKEIDEFILELDVILAKNYKASAKINERKRIRRKHKIKLHMIKAKVDSVELELKDLDDLKLAWKSVIQSSDLYAAANKYKNKCIQVTTIDNNILDLNQLELIPVEKTKKVGNEIFIDIQILPAQSIWVKKNRNGDIIWCLEKLPIYHYSDTRNNDVNATGCPSGFEFSELESRCSKMVNQGDNESPVNNWIHVQLKDGQQKVHILKWEFVNCK